MPLYFFNIHNRHGVWDKDCHGIDLPDVATAGSEASKVARELSEDWQHESFDWLDGMAIEVVNEHGQTVLTVPFPKPGSDIHLTR